MKTNTASRLLLSLSLLLAPALTQAQTSPLPKGGYWNVETNASTPNYTIVRYFNDQDQLLHEERLDNLYVNLCGNAQRCRRTTQLLNNSLQQVPQSPQSAQEISLMLAQTLGQNRRIQRLYAVR